MFTFPMWLVSEHCSLTVTLSLSLETHMFLTERFSADEEEDGLSWKLNHRLVATVTIAYSHLLYTESAQKQRCRPKLMLWIIRKIL